MIIKAANGKEIDMSQFDSKPYGVFTDYIRRNIDAKWGKEISEEDLDKTPVYNIRFKAIKTVSCYADLEIEADTIEEAKEKGLREIYRRQDLIEWDDGLDEDINEIEVDEVEELEEDEITIQRKERNSYEKNLV